MTKLELANEQIAKVVDFLKENEEKWGYTDLKLHDVSMYDFEKDFPLCCENDTNNEYGYFDDFCNLQYNMFIEDLAQNFNIDFDKIRKQLGRTSSFYLQDFVITYGNHKIDYTDTLIELWNNINGSYGMNLLDFEEEKLIVIDDTDGYEDELEEELNYFINEFYNDVIKYTKDTIVVWDYIESFKENQVEYFKDYLECQEENLKEEQERKQEEIETNKHICNDIQEKYNISDNDMIKLKRNIHDWNE